jgi:hypothetical protein
MSIEKKIYAYIMRNEPVTVQQARKDLAPDMPMPTFQKHIVNMHIGGWIEKLRTRTTRKETLWQMAKPEDKSVFHEEKI